MKQVQETTSETVIKQMKDRLPGRGDGLSSARARAEECAGTGSI